MSYYNNENNRWEMYSNYGKESTSFFEKLFEVFPEYKDVFRFSPYPALDIYDKIVGEGNFRVDINIKYKENYLELIDKKVILYNKFFNKFIIPSSSNNTTCWIDNNIWCTYKDSKVCTKCPFPLIEKQEKLKPDVFVKSLGCWYPKFIKTATENYVSLINNFSDIIVQLRPSEYYNDKILLINTMYPQYLWGFLIIRIYLLKSLLT